MIPEKEAHTPSVVPGPDGPTVECAKCGARPDTDNLLEWMSWLAGPCEHRSDTWRVPTGVKRTRKKRGT